MSIWEKFQGLPHASDGAVAALHCGASGSNLLIKGPSGESVLLVAAKARVRPRAPIQLKHVGISFDTAYEVRDTETGQAVTGTFTRFTCEAASLALHRYFINVLIAAADSQTSEAKDEAQVDEMVSSVLDLFRKFTAAPRTTVTGLWGELLVIRAAPSARAYVDAWHNDPKEAFDFAFDKFRVEVKTSERGTREHEFSLRQIQEDQRQDYVASLLLMRSAAGKNVFHLVDDIVKSLPPTQGDKLLRVVLETLGADAEAATAEMFDVTSAEKSLLFIPAAAVPRPTLEPGASPFVSDVRFRSNLSTIASQVGLRSVPA